MNVAPSGTAALTLLLLSTPGTSLLPQPRRSPAQHCWEERSARVWEGSRPEPPPKLEHVQVMLSEASPNQPGRGAVTKQGAIPLCLTVQIAF